jgi:hypothetical protein
MLRLFGKSRLTVEEQLHELATCGLHISPGLSVDDLFLFHSRAQMEDEPYRHLVETLGCEIEREPFTPICPGLWMCDCERIEDTGAYVRIIERLYLLSRQRLPVTDITDRVEIEENEAWVEFGLLNAKIHWSAKVEDDWMDPSVVVKFDTLLAEHTDLRIYSNHTDFGQAALFGCFTPDEFKKFARLSKIKLIEIKKQA